MSDYGFNVLWSEEDQGFVVTCPDFPGLSAFGESPEEALAEARLVLTLFIDSLRASGDSLPVPTVISDHSGQVRLRMPKSLHASLVQKANIEGVSLNTWIVTLLSERNAASKLVDDICSKIDNVEKAISAHAAESRQIRINKTTVYTPDFAQGEEYGKITPLFN